MQSDSAVNMVLIEEGEEPSDQTLSTNPLEVAANERKRLRVESDKGETSRNTTQAPRAMTNVPSTNEAVTEDAPTQTQGHSQVSLHKEDPRDQATEAVAKVVEGIQKAKIGFSIKDLYTLNPAAAKRVTSTFNNLAEGVRNIKWVDPSPSLGEKKQKAHLSLITLEIPNFTDEYFDDLNRKTGAVSVAAIEVSKKKSKRDPSQLRFREYLIKTKEKQECITVGTPRHLAKQTTLSDQMINVARISQPFIVSDRIIG